MTEESYLGDARNWPVPLLGLAIGDALGMPFEGRAEVDPTWAGEYRAGGYHALPAGSFTDDTQMATALADALCAEPAGFDAARVAAAYLATYRAGMRGIGGTIKVAMERLAAGVAPADAGRYPEPPARVGNGTAMRAAPLGAFYAGAAQQDTLIAAAAADADLTHAHPEARAASVAVATAVALAVQTRVAGRTARGRRPRWALLDSLSAVLAAGGAGGGPAAERSRLWVGLEELRRAANGCDDDVPAGDPYGDADPAGVRALVRRLDAGDAVGTALGALACAALAPSYEHGVAAAVRAGGDTDTRAAIAGAVLGAWFGLASIPQRWLGGLEGATSFLMRDGMLLGAGLRAGGLYNEL